MYCEKCGQQLPDHAVFCGKCGARISDEQNNFQVQEEKPVRTATNNSVGIRRSIIGICLLVGVIIVGGFFFFRRDREEIQSMESNTNNTVVQSGEEPWSDEALYDLEEEPLEEAAQNPEEDDRNEDNLTEDISESLTSNVNVGDIVTFGTYEQDNNLSTGAEPLEWIVLDCQDEKALLLSRYVIDCKPYHDHEEYWDITWAECDLRNWLNSTFYESAFDEEQQRQIIETEVLNPDNAKYGTPGGVTTYDKVFLLSLTEDDSYFSSREDRKAKATAYAMDSNLWTDDENYANWWLRSPGRRSGYAAHVHYRGAVPDYGCLEGYTYIGVRPALWVRIEE